MTSTKCLIREFNLWTSSHDRNFRNPVQMKCRDFNHDNSADFFDYLDYVNAFSNQSPEADFNHDGAIDFFDYLDFVDAFSAGC
jgi:hypothetical protein